ncbi:MAG: hypothetical protein AB1792_09760 [Candidatus Zixiibacteriota bacterium]
MTPANGIGNSSPHVVVALRRLARSGGIVAAAFALKLPLFAVPNVEPLTLAFVLVGYAYGSVWGAMVGTLSMAVYATFNPWGAAIPPVWGAQIVGMGLAGLVGGLARPLLGRMGTPGRASAVAVGVAVTLVYDVLTNLAFAFAIGPFVPVMIAAIPFSALHVLSNALLFGAIFPILGRWLTRPAASVAAPS